MKRRFRVSRRAEARIEEITSSLYKCESMAREIIEYTHQPENDVWRKLCLELEQPGYNVTQQAGKYNVTPHVFNDNMLRLYRESDGFIYETLVESRNPYRREKWLNICRFLLRHCEEKANERKILVYGDSVGSDSLFLSQLGFDVHYHDFDSYCSGFAKKRFSNHQVTIRPFTGTNSGATFDYVICLEVAEHVPDPALLIRELADLTKSGGCCVFSEGFELVVPYLPTHLKSNLQYTGKSDELFKRTGMNVLWRDRQNKPIVYIKGGVFRSCVQKILWKITKG